MFSSPTISSYILRQFLLWFLVMFATIVAVIGLIDAIEQLVRHPQRQRVHAPENDKS